MPILVLIESPGKQKKIQSFLGNDYIVEATMGHIRELSKEELGFDISNNFEPTFQIIPEKNDIVKKIKAKAKDVDKIVLSTDKDQEGHSISWHCAEILKIPANKRYRSTFTEVTKTAVCTAINNTLSNNTLLDMNQVYAQFARMVLDKLIGYKVSPLLWKEYNNWHLSAGRVQSCLVKLVAERENEISKFSSEPYFKIDARFLLDKNELKNAATTKYINTICDSEVKDQTTVDALYNQLKSQSPETPVWHVSNIGKTQSKRNPSPPFITSSLQQEASSRLGMSPDACMKLAQKLYEAGAITYMRTDALFMAEDAMKALKICIENRFGERFYRRVDYKTKSASSEGGHESIRPTDFAKESVLNLEGMTASHNRLYQLIWRRAVASQMSPAEVEILTVKFSQSNSASANTNTLLTNTQVLGNTATETKSKARKAKGNIKTIAIPTEPILSSDTPSIAGITFTGKHEKVLFDGYLACLNMHKTTKKSSNANAKVASEQEDAEEDTDDETGTTSAADSAYLEKVFSKLKEGEPAFAISLDAVQKYTKPAQARYTEASIIKKLDDLGIGRPSTYASMIKIVQEEQRQYVERKSLPPKKLPAVRMGYQFPDVITSETQQVAVEGDKNKLFPTPLGIMINEYLDKNFAEIINYEFTAQVEALLDEIAAGSKVWHRVVDSVYIRLNPIIDQLAKATATRKQNQKQNQIANGGAGGTGGAAATADGIQPDTENRKLLGMHPTTGLPVYAIRSRQGFLICESNPDKAKSRFASFTGRFDSMTLEDAVGLLVFPRMLGTYKDAEVILKKAKNVYLAWNGKNYSIENYMKYTNSEGAGADPATTSLEEAIAILQYYEGADARKQASAARDRVLSEDIVIKVGPYGAYIKYKGHDNIKLSKALKDRWETITLEEVMPTVEKHIANPGKATSSRGRGASARGRGASARGRGASARGRGRGS
jgi:DNA topoisomerase-1